MPNTTILSPTEEESENTPKKFRNIDTEEFVFTWDSKPFGGSLPERMRGWKEEVIDRDMMGKETGRRMVQRYEILKPILPNEVVVMPKYLVNYAAMHLARKIYKRKIFAGKTEVERSVGILKFVNAEEEMKLQKEMVADNFSTETSPTETPIETPVAIPTPTVATPTQTIPTEEKKEEETKKPEEVSWKCECGFIAKNKVGLLAHKRFRHKS